MSCDIALVPTPDEAIHVFLRDRLREFNRNAIDSGHPSGDLAVIIRDGEKEHIIGGLWGRTGRGWLSVELIFVPEELRGQGIARRLLAVAEAEGLRRGCHSAWLDTLNPEAALLYERLGYRRFGELKDYPVGNSRIFLQKPLKNKI